MNFLNGYKIEKIDGDSFKIDAGGKTDYFIDKLSGYDMHNAPFYYNDVEGDFIIQAKITPGFKETYDAGGILVLDDDSHWIKAAYELTDLGHPSLVTVVTNGVSDDCNGEKAEADKVFIRVLRKGDYWAVHYSIDGLDWEMVRYFSLGSKRGSGRGSLRSRRWVRGGV